MEAILLNSIPNIRTELRMFSPFTQPQQFMPMPFSTMVTDIVRNESTT